jgi:hypothetical protein
LVVSPGTLRYNIRVELRLDESVREYAASTYIRQGPSDRGDRLGALTAQESLPSRQNTTDKVDAVDRIHLRYILLLVYPWATPRRFLAKKGHGAQDVEKDAPGLAEVAAASSHALEPLGTSRRVTGRTS